ncbi:MAG: hypothetical protein ACFFCS_09140 [Candidatus Hodarchaeota archaeon]
MYIIDFKKFYADQLHNILWNLMEFGILIILVVIGIYYFILYRRKREENRIQATFNLGYTFFFLILAINQVVYLSDSGIFLPQLNPYFSTDAKVILEIIGAGIYDMPRQILYMFILFILPFLCILYPTERYLRNSKRFPISILMVISIVSMTTVLVIAHIYPEITTMPAGLYGVLFVLHPIIVIIVLLTFITGMVGGISIYMAVGIQTTGELRKKSFITAFGFIVWFLSVVGGNLFKSELEGLNPFLILLGPAMFYTGTFMFLYSFRRD